MHLLRFNLTWLTLSILLISYSSFQLRYISSSFPVKNKLNCVEEAQNMNDYDSFHDFDSIPIWLKNRLEELNFTSPNLVQRTSLPRILSGHDVVLQAQTGSGKTLAYAIPILSKIEYTRACIQAVIVVPTRELGLQVSAVFKQLSKGSTQKIMIMSLVEGSKNQRQSLWAVAEPPHIIVGNPKSLQKLVDNGRLRLNSVSFVVLDEVDAILSNTDTRQDLHELLSRKLSNTFKSADDNNNDASQADSLVYNDMTKHHRDLEGSRALFRQHRQTILCSATIPQRQHFAASCYKNGWTLNLPELIHISSKDLVPPQVHHEYVECSKEQVYSCLKYLIRKELTTWNDKSKVKKETRASKDNVHESNKPINLEKATKLRKYFRSKAVGGLEVKSNSELDKEITVQTSIDSQSIARPEFFQAMVFLNDDDLPSSSSSSMVSLRMSKYSNSDVSLDRLLTVDGYNLAVLMEDIETILTGKLNPSWSSGLSSVGMLTESMSLDQRADALNAFRDGRYKVLLCTSTCARGIDVPDVTHVFQCSLPKSVDDYIHKSGRVGRLGRDGHSIVIIPPGSDFIIERYSNEIGVKIEKRTLKVKS